MTFSVFGEVWPRWCFPEDWWGFTIPDEVYRFSVRFFPLFNVKPHRKPKTSSNHKPHRVIKTSPLVVKPHRAINLTKIGKPHRISKIQIQDPVISTQTSPDLNYFQVLTAKRVFAGFLEKAKKRRKTLRMKARSFWQTSPGKPHRRSDNSKNRNATSLNCWNLTAVRFSTRFPTKPHRARSFASKNNANW